MALFEKDVMKYDKVEKAEHLLKLKTFSKGL